MKRYLIIIEKTKTGFSAYSPDVPGCVAAARTKKSVEHKIVEAILFHLEGLKLEGQKLPRSSSYSTYLEFAA
ncbi:MAG: type II toxin-antitoxin system HicB family antitoxin [Deltaproteobacteria bacterium]|nr:type II toxin-antitoxin system HicB family antitoxin [Deltaproteobacteria bacterium]